MNIFKRVTKNTLKEAKVRTIVTIIGVVLASCLFTAATTFVWSIFNYAEELVEKEGDYYIKLEDDDNSLYNRMKSDKDVAYMTRKNYMGEGKFIEYDTALENLSKLDESIDNVYKDNMYRSIYGIDDNSFMLGYINVLSGRMPKSSKEIIIGEELANDLGEKGEIGSVISVPILKNIEYKHGKELEKAFTEDKNNYSEEYQYTIVGHDESLYSAYTYIDNNFVSKESELYVKLKKKFNLDMEKFLNKYGINIDDEEVNHINSLLLAFSGSFKDAEDLITYSWLFAIFFIIIIVASVVLISSTFMISVSERTKQFGLLSSIGATKKQLCKSLIYEASYVSGIGIPIGIIMGLVGMGITIKILGAEISRMIVSIGSFNEEVLEIKYMIHPMAIIVAIILTMLTIGISLLIPIIRLRKVTAIEAIRQNKEIKVKKRKVRVRRLTKKLAGLEGILATKYYKVSSSKYRVTVVSLSMSMVLFVVTFSVSGMARVIVDKNMKDYPYDIRMEQVNIYDENNDDLEKEFVEDVKELKEIKSIKYCYDGWDQIVINKEDVNVDYIKNSDWYREYIKNEKGENNSSVDNKSATDDVPQKIVKDVTILYVDDVQYKEILEKEGLDKSKYLGVAEPKALVYNKSLYSSNVSCDIFNKTKNSLTIIDLDKLEDIADGYGEDYLFDYNILPENMYDLEDYKDIGEGKVVYYEVDDESNKSGFKEGELYTNELPIGDYIYSLPHMPEFVGDDDIYVIYPESAVAADYSCNIYINVKDYEKFSSEFYKLLASYDIDKDTIDDFCDRNNFVDSIMFIVKVFIYGFLILIALTSIANVFNTITTNIILRRRDIATLRSVGLSSKSVDKMMRYECLIYGIKATLIGIPLALLANFGISKVLGIDGFSEYGVNNLINYLNLLIPYKAILIAVIVVIAIVYISMAYAINIIKKDNILDTLKNENI